MLVLPPAERERIDRAALGAYPREACGLLVGTFEGEGARVLRAELVPNSAGERAHERFEIAPGDFIAIDERARAEGLEIVGVWHSHPDRAAVPSRADRAVAEPRWSHVIVATSRWSVTERRAWRLEGASVREIALRDT